MSLLDFNIVLGVGESSAITCGFESVDDLVKLALKLGIKDPNSTIRMIAGSSYPTNSAEVGNRTWSMTIHCWYSILINLGWGWRRPWFLD